MRKNERITAPLFSAGVRNRFSLPLPLGIFAEITSFRRFANDPSRRDEFGTFLSKWRDYQFKVANSASSSTATAAAATAVSASSTPRKIICNKIVIYVRVPGKRAAQTLHSALRPSGLPVLPSSLVVRGYAEVEDDGKRRVAVNAFRRTLTFHEDYIILGDSSGNSLGASRPSYSRGTPFVPLAIYGKREKKVLLPRWQTASPRFIASFHAVMRTVKLRSFHFLEFVKFAVYSFRSLYRLLGYSP